MALAADPRRIGIRRGSPAQRVTLGGAPVLGVAMLLFLDTGEEQPEPALVQPVLSREVRLAPGFRVEAGLQRGAREQQPAFRVRLGAAHQALRRREPGLRVGDAGQREVGELGMGGLGPGLADDRLGAPFPAGGAQPSGIRQCRGGESGSLASTPASPARWRVSGRIRPRLPPLSARPLHCRHRRAPGRPSSCPSGSRAGPAPCAARRRRDGLPRPGRPGSRPRSSRRGPPPGAAVPDSPGRRRPAGRRGRGTRSRLHPDDRRDAQPRRSAAASAAFRPTAAARALPPAARRRVRRQPARRAPVWWHARPAGAGARGVAAACGAAAESGPRSARSARRAARRSPAGRRRPPRPRPGR